MFNYLFHLHFEVTFYIEGYLYSIAGNISGYLRKNFLQISCFVDKDRAIALIHKNIHEILYLAHSRIFCRIKFPAIRYTSVFIVAYTYQGVFCLRLLHIRIKVSSVCSFVDASLCTNHQIYIYHG